MVNSVIKSHTRTKIGKTTGDSQHDINQRHGTRNLGDAWQNSIAGIKCFGLKNLHTANLQHWKHGNRHNNNTQASQPFQNSAPKQRSWCSIIQINNHCCPGGCNTRHGFKNRIDKMRYHSGKIERKCTKKGQRNPGTNCHQKRLANTQSSHCTARRQPQAQTNKAGYDGCNEKALPFLMPQCCIYNGRQHHRAA